MSNIPNSWGQKAYSIQTTTSAFEIVVRGRCRWALECLVQAGAKGCTPLDKPGPRWSGYVFDLRELGVEIETISEPHKGPFPGTHARYVLRSIVTASEKGAAA